MSFASDQSFEEKFKQVNPQKSFSQKHYKKYKRYKKVMFDWVEKDENSDGKASPKFYQKLNENLEFFKSTLVIMSKSSMKAIQTFRQKSK